MADIELDALASAEVVPEPAIVREGSAPIPWTDLENAVIAFAERATGLQAIWGNQKAQRPAYPYVSVLSVSGPTPVGIDENRVEDAEPGSRKPAVLIACGPRSWTVSLKVLGVPGQLSSARRFAGVLMAAVELPLYRDGLHAVGAAVSEVKPVTLPDEQVASGWLPRAAVEIRFGISSNLAQPMDVIETVSVKATGDGVGSLPNSLIIDQTFGG